MQKFTKFALSLVMAFFAVLAVNAQGTYAVEKGAAALAAGTQITSVPNITMTYGVSGGAEFKAVKERSDWDGATGTYVAFYEGNGENGTATSGTVYYFEPTKNGTLEVAYVLNREKAFFIQEDGTSMEGFDGITLAAKVYKATTINVKAGSKYTVYCKGSKLGFGGFTYTVTEPAGTEADPIILTAGVPAKGPKAATQDPSTYQWFYPTWYQYTATKDGVVKLDLNGIYVMGNIYVGEQIYSYSSPVMVKAGDVVKVNLGAQTDASDKTFTLNFREYAEGETIETAKALVEGNNAIANIGSGEPANYYKFTVPAGKKMTITFDGYPSAFFVVNGEENKIEMNGSYQYEGSYNNTSETDVTVYVKITALYTACNATVALSDATPELPAITKMGQPVFYANTTALAEGATLDAAPYYIRIMFPETDAQPTDIVVANARVFELGADGNPTGAPLNTQYEYTSTVQDGIAISNVKFEAGKTYMVQVSSVNFRETADLGYRKEYAYSYPNANENPNTITDKLSFSVKGGAHVIDAKIVETEGVYTLSGTWTNLGTGKAYLDTEDNAATIAIDDAGVATITFVAPTEPGNHYLYVQENAVVDADGNYNGATSALIIVEGVNTIVAGKYVLTAKVEKCVENIPSEFEEFVGVYKTFATLYGEANALTISENSVNGIFDGFVIKGDAVAYSKDLAILLKGKKFNVRSLDGYYESGLLKLTATENGYTMVGASIWYNGVKVATVDNISIEKDPTSGIKNVTNAPKANGKYLMNGKIVIVKDNVKYNVSGAVIK